MGVTILPRQDCVSEPDEIIDGVPKYKLFDGFLSGTDLEDPQKTGDVPRIPATVYDVMRKQLEQRWRLDGFFTGDMFCFYPNRGGKIIRYENADRDLLQLSKDGAIYSLSEEYYNRAHGLELTLEELGHTARGEIITDLLHSSDLGTRIFRYLARDDESVLRDIELVRKENLYIHNDNGKIVDCKRGIQSPEFYSNSQEPFVAAWNIGNLYTEKEYPYLSLFRHGNYTIGIAHTLLQQNIAEVKEKVA